MKCEAGFWNDQNSKDGFQIVLIPENKEDRIFVRALFDAGLCDGAGGIELDSIHIYFSEKGVFEEPPND